MGASDWISIAAIAVPIGFGLMAAFVNYWHKNLRRDVDDLRDDFERFEKQRFDHFKNNQQAWNATVGQKTPSASIIY